jgi:prepilin-type N-terminal cleavage/methylation domain-containing protein
MNAIETAIPGVSHPAPANRRRRGFSLLELLVATAVFLIVAGAAFSLFNQHVKLATHQQNLSTVNIGLRNAMTQLEIDLSGAGQNLLSSVNNVVDPPAFSLGVIINNSVPGTAANCTPASGTWTYPVPSACFDSLTIINPKAACPVIDISDPGSSQESLSTSSTIFADDPNNPGNSATLTADASCYNNGDEILVVQLPTSGQQQVNCDNGPFNYCMAVVNLTQDALVTGGKIKLQHNPTGASADPLGIIFNGSSTNNFAEANSLNTDFNNGAYIIDLGDGSTAVTYSVQTSPSDSTDTQLLRCTGVTCTTANEQLLSDQVIGFKVGAALWDNAQANATDIANYYFDPTKYCSDAIVASAGPPPTYVDCTQTPPAAYDPYDYALIRAIRISMIGRTRPSGDLSLLNFTNGFDNGPYLVQQASVVIDLRNLSNPDSIN